VVAPRRSQDNGGDHPGRGGSSDEPRGQIAAEERGPVAAEASWRWSCSRVVKTAN